jgi:hypothetical protein
VQQAIDRKLNPAQATAARGQSLRASTSRYTFAQMAIDAGADGESPWNRIPTNGATESPALFGCGVIGPGGKAWPLVTKYARRF